MNIVNAKYCLSDYILGCLKPLSRKCVLQFASQQTLTKDAVRRLEVPAVVVAVTAAAVFVVWIDVVDV